MRSKPRVSVIVAAYHSADFLDACLDALEKQRYRDFETIVVNSSPESRTAEVVARFPAVRLFQSPERLLPHAARNAGVSLAGGGLFAFTDADCRADPHWLEELVEAHEVGHEVVGGCIDSAARDRVSRGIHVLKYSPYLRRAAARPLWIVATGNMLVSRRVVEKVGPFDGSIFCGDALFTWKAREAGFIPWYRPGAIVTDQDERYRRGFLAERYRRGEEFGRVRATFEGWSPGRSLLRGALAPLAMLFALARIGSECGRAGRLYDFVATLPLQVAAQAAWCLGEARAYVVLGTMRRRGRKTAGGPTTATSSGHEGQ